MPVYIAKKVAPVAVAPAPFQARELRNYAPAAVSTIGIRGIAHYREVAFQLYRSNIDAFCASSIKNTRIYTGASGYFDHNLTESTLPLPVPSVAFSPRVKLSDDQAKAALAKLGETASMKVIGKTQEFTIPSPSFNRLAPFIAFSNPNFAVSTTKLSALGFGAYIKAISLVDAFLATHYYPAFRELDSPIPQALDIELTVAGISDDKKKEYFYDYKAKLGPKSESVIDSHSTMKRQKLGDGYKQISEDLEEMAIDAEYELPAGTYGAMQLGVDSSVVTAKPSGRPSSTNYGPVGSVPASPGLLFPYFKGMMRPDPIFIKDQFVTHFFRLFGTDRDSCMKNIVEIKRGVNNMAGTDAGIEISHMIKGIDLALETQTRLFLIIENGAYNGFVLLGGRFSIWDGSQWISPLSTDDLKAELNTLDVHSVAVETIAEELSKMSLKNTLETMVISAEDLRSALEIMERITERQIPANYDKTKINKALQSLIWEKPYSPVNPDSVISFVQASLLDNYTPTTKDPMFLPNIDAPYHDKEFRCLAMFGPDAPSFQNSSRDRQIISIIREMSRKGKEAEAKTPDPPKVMYIYQKPLLTAWNDWIETTSKGTISFNPKERARGYRAHEITSPQKVQELWVVMNKGLEEKASKEEAGPSKKKAKVVDASVVTDADQLLGLL